MGLDTIHLCEHLIVYPYLDQGYLGKQGEHHRRRRYGCLLPISELAIPEGICYTRGPKE